MSSVGTWRWAERSGGRLSRRDRGHLLRQGVIARLSRLPAPWRRAVLGKQSPLELPDPPDSALAQMAEERVRELSAPVLYAHCLRTWAFAALFAQRDRVAHDEELLYLACVLHDLGLTSAHDQHDSTAVCFAVEGARAAHELLCRHGQAETRAGTVAQAISLHLNIDVPERLGAEAHLLSKGVSPTRSAAACSCWVLRRFGMSTAAGLARASASTSSRRRAGRRGFGHSRARRCCTVSASRASCVPTRSTKGDARESAEAGRRLVHCPCRDLPGRR